MILGYSHNIPQKVTRHYCITRVIETSGTIAKVVTKQKTAKTNHSTELRAVAPCNPIEQMETTEDSTDPRIGFVSNLILFTRENYYKFWLQYKNSKSKSLF